MKIIIAVLVSVLCIDLLMTLEVKGIICPPPFIPPSSYGGIRASSEAARIQREAAAREEAAAQSDADACGNQQMYECFEMLDNSSRFSEEETILACRKLLKRCMRKFCHEHRNSSRCKKQ